MANYFLIRATLHVDGYEYAALFATKSGRVALSNAEALQLIAESLDDTGVMDGAVVDNRAGCYTVDRTELVYPSVYNIVAPYAEVV